MFLKYDHKALLSFIRKNSEKQIFKISNHSQGELWANFFKRMNRFYSTKKEIEPISYDWSRSVIFDQSNQAWHCHSRHSLSDEVRKLAYLNPLTCGCCFHRSLQFIDKTGIVQKAEKYLERQRLLRKKASLIESIENAKLQRDDKEMERLIRGSPKTTCVYVVVNWVAELF